MSPLFGSFFFLTALEEADSPAQDLLAVNKLISVEEANRE
jgi:hypothetical protein